MLTQKCSLDEACVKIINSNRPSELLYIDKADVSRC